MKYFLVFIVLFVALFILANKAKPAAECRVETQYAGRFYNSCPFNYVATGVDLWQVGNHTNVMVECSRLRITCE